MHLVAERGRQSSQSFIATNADARKNFLEDQRAQTQQHTQQAAAATASAQASRAEARRASADESRANAEANQANAEALLANAQSALAQAQMNRDNAVGPAEQLTQEAQTALARAQISRDHAIGPTEQLAQQAQTALTQAQTRREGALTALSDKIGATLAQIRRQLGRPSAGHRTTAQREATYQLVLELVQLTDRIGPGQPTPAPAAAINQSR